MSTEYLSSPEGVVVHEVEMHDVHNSHDPMHQFEVQPIYGFEFNIFGIKNKIFFFKIILLITTFSF